MSAREVSRFWRRRWFADSEGVRTSPGERVVWVFLGYIVGGLGYLAVNHLVGDGPFHHLTLPLDVAMWCEGKQFTARSST